ncbi:MAG TPA: HD domain-containing protein [Ktedonobacteraceae bacterium]|nr:HD domain-containing protein [Ktedonobacteraceae bacterium]
MLLTERFEEALVLAAQFHARQSRKGTTIPYISHLLAVTSLVLENGGNEDEAIAALLHDAVEDQGGTDAREKIRRLFGDTVVAIVDGCSDTDQMPKPPWRARKERYIAHLLMASPSVRLVSAADKLHNVRSILADYRIFGEVLWRRFNGGKAGTLWYYRSVTDVLRKAGPSSLIDELDRTLTELERLADEPDPV